MIVCPKCNTYAQWHELSSGGDGLYKCPECEWVEDPTKIGEEYRGIEE